MCSSEIFLSSKSLLGRPRVIYTVTEAPHLCSKPAMRRPSEPLLPGPTSTVIFSDIEGDISCFISVATACAAFCIKSKVLTPSSELDCSNVLICLLVTIFIFICERL